MSVALRHTVSLHDRPGDPHFDLFIQQPDAEPLATWNLTAPPSVMAVGEVRPAKRVVDHRAVYLDFSGDIGGGRGTVTPRETGPAEWLERSTGRSVVRLGAGVFELLGGPGEGGTIRRTG